MSGRLKQEIPVLHLLTGAAVAFANLWREWRRYTSAVGRVMERFGTRVFEFLAPSCNIFVNVLSEQCLRQHLLPDFCPLMMPRDSWYMIKLIIAHMDSQKLVKLMKSIFFFFCFKTCNLIF